MINTFLEDAKRQLAQAILQRESLIASLYATKEAVQQLKGFVAALEMVSREEDKKNEAERT